MNSCGGAVKIYLIDTILTTLVNEDDLDEAC